MKMLPCLRAFTSWLLIAACAAATFAQQGPTQPSPSASATKSPSGGDRRRAAKLYLDAAKLYKNGQFEAALHNYEQAAQLDGSNQDYRLAAEVARSHAVTALLQTAAQQRARGNLAEARSALIHALAVDPGNQAAADRLRQADGPADPPASVEQVALPSPALGGMEELAPSAGLHSFHLRSNQRQVIQQVFRAWGIEAAVDDSVRANVVRLDLDDATFTQAARAMALLTNSFYVPVDEHRALVASDTRDMRLQYMHKGVETLPLSGLSSTEMTDMAALARNVFEMTQVAVDATAATITLRGSQQTLQAFNATYEGMMQGKSEVLVDVRLIQLAHTNARNTGLQPTQQIGVFNVLSEYQSLKNANQSLINQIIASGLAGPNDIGAILAILLASGQVTSSVFSNGFVTFGGNCSLASGGTCSPFAFGASPGPTTLHLNLNSSDSRALDNYRLRLMDGEEGTLKSGTRYPIQTSQFSSGSASSLNIPGLTGAGNSGALAGLLANLQGASQSIPQIQYEDLGLTLKARPRIMRSGDVALNLDMKVSALAGPSLNGVPVLASRAYSGVVTLPANQSVVIASEMDKNESRAISGFPGLSEIPGLNDTTDKNVQKNYSTLLIILTPYVVRLPHGLGHTPMIPIDRSTTMR